MLAPPLAVVLLAALALGGCGESGDAGAEELARQQELRAARAQAAQDARQSTRIEELERRLRRRNASGRQPYVPPTDPGPVTEAAPSGVEGVWRGEAVINYEDGRSDPFVETVQIHDLTPGQRAGNAEAVQGSTTCHGPLTFEGVSDGWYVFSAEEQNESECIDFSQVELMPDEAGNLSYRETTDVSVSEGRLQRVR